MSSPSVIITIAAITAATAIVDPSVAASTPAVLSVFLVLAISRIQSPDGTASTTVVASAVRGTVMAGATMRGMRPVFLLLLLLFLLLVLVLEDVGSDGAGYGADQRAECAAASLVSQETTTSTTD